MLLKEYVLDKKSKTKLFLSFKNNNSNKSMFSFNRNKLCFSDKKLAFKNSQNSIVKFGIFKSLIISIEYLISS